MVTKIWEFLHKISHNLVFIEAIAKNPASSRRFSRSHNLGLIDILKRPTLVSKVTKMWEF